MVVSLAGAEPVEGPIRVVQDLEVGQSIRRLDAPTQRCIRAAEATVLLDDEIALEIGTHERCDLLVHPTGKLNTRRSPIGVDKEVGRFSPAALVEIHELTVTVRKPKLREHFAGPQAEGRLRGA